MSTRTQSVPSALQKHLPRGDAEGNIELEDGRMLRLMESLDLGPTIPESRRWTLVGGEAYTGLRVTASVITLTSGRQTIEVCLSHPTVYPSWVDVIAVYRAFFPPEAEVVVPVRTREPYKSYRLHLLEQDATGRKES